jgi:hypothetical protein
MEINSKVFEENFEKFRDENCKTSLYIQSNLELLYKKCRNKLDFYYMVEEPLLMEKMKEGYINYYYLLDKTFFHPYNCKVKAQEIYLKMDYIGFMKGGLNLNQRLFVKYTDSIMREIFYRSINGSEEINLDKLLKDLGDHLFNYSIYQNSNSVMMLYASNANLELYPNEPLLGFGHTFLKDLSEQQIANHEKYEDSQVKLKQLMIGLGKGFVPFNNFSTAINKLYDALISLQTIKVNRESFLEVLANNYSEGSDEKITIELKHKLLTTSQIGLLFFILREDYCSNYEKYLFREWFQKNFIIIKKNDRILQITEGNTASDLLAQYKSLSNNSRKYKIIKDLF